ncbi:hypothetical protein [Alicyclobacillus shizuokensis]|uniref:hypothetical protein n=1 Tax=Alicyclobacillus shizuokensis TaxID=392014 RepID=UPI00082B99F8|nr:hypothetical protein [Alicyclobacillus shizuokensis]MCL6627561.1 hypothetical protein [Alicyclobacillus shizuokensis]
MKLRFAVTLLILGALVGAVAMLCVLGSRIDTLSTELQKSETTIEELNAQIQHLKDQAERPVQKPTIQKFSVEIVQAPSDVTELQKIRAAEYVKQRLAFLVGLPLDPLVETPAFIPSIIDGRTITIDDKAYRFHVKTLVIGEVPYLQVTLTAVE